MKRAALRAVVFVLATTCIIVAGAAVDDATRIDDIAEWAYPDGKADEDGFVELVEHSSTFSIGLLAIPEATSVERRNRLPETEAASRRLSRRQSARFEWWPSPRAVIFGMLLSLWVVLTWALPAGVGLCTQIRKGLPPFARAPRTVSAAALYESHRLLYLAVVVLAWMVVDVVARQNLLHSLKNPLFIVLPLVSLLTMVGACSCATWVGALRSDYTRQLVRSRFHAFRIVLVYAVILPSVVTFAIAALHFGPAGW